MHFHSCLPTDSAGVPANYSHRSSISGHMYHVLRTQLTSPVGIEGARNSSKYQYMCVIRLNYHIFVLFECLVSSPPPSAPTSNTWLRTSSQHGTALTFPSRSPGESYVCASRAQSIRLPVLAMHRHDDVVTACIDLEEALNKSHVCDQECGLCGNTKGNLEPKGPCRLGMLGRLCLQ